MPLYFKPICTDVETGQDDVEISAPKPQLLMIQETEMDRYDQPVDGDKLEGRRKNPVTETQIADLSTAPAKEKHEKFTPL